MSSRRILGLAAALLLAGGCARAPSPLAPQFAGSIGMPHRGVLTASTELPAEGEGYKWLRQDDRHHGLPRFVKAIERAAGTVARERPGAVLGVGDLSTRTGGQLLPHLSHRTGRDADLLLYVTTLDGAPVESPGFIHVGNDGLAWDDKGKRFLRFDVERTWLLVKTLVEDPDARIQWIFAHRNVEALLVEWARARGEHGDTIVRAMDVMLQPRPGGPHDDHVHIRTACSPAELVAGCEHTGPSRPWIEALDRSARDGSSDWELVDALFRPFGATQAAHETTVSVAPPPPTADASTPALR
ncbi:MAG: penicillin-insensitive murein endopeptidase [Labilithrix sp.]|nr:penicillin-insensitive murein endopeptidase [Labilithrix sp.]